MQTWWTGSKTLSHRGGASWELQLCYQLGVPLLQGGQVLEVPLQLLVARFQRVDVVVELLDDVTDGVAPVDTELPGEGQTLAIGEGACGSLSGGAILTSHSPIG